MELTLADIAEAVDGKVTGDPGRIVRRVAPFESAGKGDITFAGNAAFLKKIGETEADAVIVPRGTRCPGKDLVETDIPYVAFAKTLQLFNPVHVPNETTAPGAVIGSDFRRGQKVGIGASAVIGDRVVTGDRVSVMAGTYIGNDVVIGDDVLIYPNVTIMDGSVVGSRVTIHAGTVIGSDGFGFAPDGKRFHKIPHTGIVQIDDDVEIGAGNTIDRATFGKTWIQSGVKTDNLVHIAHNVTIGENTVVVAQVGIAGSSSVGNNCVLAGQAGISGHLNIGNYVTIGPKSGVTKSISDGQVVSGCPEMPHKLWLKVNRLIPRLPDFRKKISELEKRLAALEEKGR